LSHLLKFAISGKHQEENDNITDYYCLCKLIEGGMKFANRELRHRETIKLSTQCDRKAAIRKIERGVWQAEPEANHIFISKYKEVSWHKILK